jgi:SAM-dependent methyltransferase
MQRTTQELLYAYAGPSIERQLPELIEKFRERKNKLGSLTLDSKLPLPKYHAAVDIHCKPGGYHTELTDDCVFAGAEFDRTFRLYSMGGLGENLDDIGVTSADWIKRSYPDLSPQRILDMGCTVGHSTLPLSDAWPEAEIHAIDVAAPCLRYAHARAVEFGREVHFSQQNAEHTNFEDESFDLVISQIMMHETSHAALRQVFRECHRLLKPGGLMVHVDGICQGEPYTRYYSEWMAHYNNEPFIGTLQDQDFAAITREAGFDKGMKVDQAPSLHRPKSNEGKTNSAYDFIAAIK